MLINLRKKKVPIKKDIKPLKLWLLCIFLSSHLMTYKKIFKLLKVTKVYRILNGSYYKWLKLSGLDFTFKNAIENIVQCLPGPLLGGWVGRGIQNLFKLLSFFGSYTWKLGKKFPFPPLFSILRGNSLSPLLSPYP